MAVRADRIALAALLALAAPLGAGDSGPWRTDPMMVRLDSAYTNVFVGSFSGAAPGDDLLVVAQSAQVRPFHALLTRVPTPFSFPNDGTWPQRSGYLAQNGADALADVARVYGGSVKVAFGTDGVFNSYPMPCSGDALAFVRLLPRTADVLVLSDSWDWDSARLTAVDFDPALVPSTRQRSWQLGPGGPGSLHMEVYALAGQSFDAAPIRLSDSARNEGIDDVALLGFGGAVLFVHEAPPATADLFGIQFAPPIEVGGFGGGAFPPPGPPTPWLPPTIPKRGDVLGIAAVDVNLDSKLDLVFTQSIPFWVGGEPVQGAAVWVEGTGRPAEFADWTLTPWHDLGLELGLVKPLIVRQIEVSGVPAVAIWDWGLQQVIVAWPDYGAGMLRTWRAPAPGFLATDIRQADLVGSPEKDLVIVMANAPLPDAVLVYPDVGLPSPALSWAQGSPGTPVRGAPHTLEVVLDPAAPATITVEWIEGAPTTAPVAQGYRLVQHVFPPVCTMPPPDLVVTVRATDDTGVFTELGSVLPVSALQPAISLRGATPPGRLVLDPEHATTAVFDGVAATGCGTASWGGAWPAAATVSDASGPDWVRRTVTLPPAAYPELLSDPDFAVSLATSDPGVAEPMVLLPLQLDGSQLVEVIHQSDRTALADGEIAVLRTRLRSRIGYALPRVRVVDRLMGLVPAGAATVSGAAVVSSASRGADLVLDALPAAPAEVTIELPVRSTGGPGASAAEAWSEGGWPLSPPAGADADAEALPGCGCGAGGAGDGLAALALLLAARRRSRRSGIATT
jgi:hypothetical protein